MFANGEVFKFEGFFAEGVLVLSCGVPPAPAGVLPPGPGIPLVVTSLSDIPVTVTKFCH